VRGIPHLTIGLPAGRRSGEEYGEAQQVKGRGQVIRPVSQSSCGQGEGHTVPPPVHRESEWGGVLGSLTKEEKGAVQSAHLSIGLPVGPSLLTAMHAQCSLTRAHGSGRGGGASSSRGSSAGGTGARRRSAEAGLSRWVCSEEVSWRPAATNFGIWSTAGGGGEGGFGGERSEGERSEEAAGTEVDCRPNASKVRER
jgi:hypothetical protein